MISPVSISICIGLIIFIIITIFFKDDEKKISSRIRQNVLMISKTGLKIPDIRIRTVVAFQKWLCMILIIESMYLEKYLKI